MVGRPALPRAWQSAAALTATRGPPERPPTRAAAARKHMGNDLNRKSDLCWACGSIRRSAAERGSDGGLSGGGLLLEQDFLA